MIEPFSLNALKAMLGDNLATLHRLLRVDVACALGAFYVALKLGQVVRRRLKTTALCGPPSPSLIWGMNVSFLFSSSGGKFFEEWTEEYGGAYEIPTTLGGKMIILSDPRALAHFYAGGATTYALTPADKTGAEQLIGRGLLVATGESHRRQRKIFSPAFSNAAIRNLTSLFYDSAYKAKGAWDTLIESSGEGGVVIDVQNWMKRITLDTIGTAGYSHDFGSLDGKPSLVGDALGAFGDMHNNPSALIFIALTLAMPWLVKLPTPYSNLITQLNAAMSEIANEVLAKSRKETEAVPDEKEKASIIDLLLRAENQDSQLHLTTEEVTAQLKVLLLAAYDTVSIALAWILIDLCQNPHVQTKLRTELFEFGADPTYDQLPNNLPYLDAVIHESLRMHPAHTKQLRVATRDDVVPLSKPVRTRSGKLVDHISVAKGNYVTSPALSINQSTALWGPNAKEFDPERWITEDGIPAEAKQVQGHRHTLTFSDGARSCPGKSFALTELKVVLAVLVKNFTFEFVGPDTVIAMEPTLVPRPKVAGEKGDAIPIRVRRFE